MSNIIPMVSASPPPMDEGGGFNDWGDDDDDFGDFASANDSQFSAFTSTDKDEQLWSTSMPSTPVKYSSSCDTNDNVNSIDSLSENTSTLSTKQVLNTDGANNSDLCHSSSNNKWCSTECLTTSEPQNKEIACNINNKNCHISVLSSANCENNHSGMTMPVTESVTTTCISEMDICQNETGQGELTISNFSHSGSSEESMSLSISAGSKENSPDLEDSQSIFSGEESTNVIGRETSNSTLDDTIASLEPETNQSVAHEMTNCSSEEHLECLGKEYIKDSCLSNVSHQEEVECSAKLSSQDNETEEFGVFLNKNLSQKDQRTFEQKSSCENSMCEDDDPDFKKFSLGVDTLCTNEGKCEQDKQLNTGKDGLEQYVFDGDNCERWHENEVSSKQFDVGKSIGEKSLSDNVKEENNEFEWEEDVGSSKHIDVGKSVGEESLSDNVKEENNEFEWEEDDGSENAPVEKSDSEDSNDQVSSDDKAVYSSSFKDLSNDVPDLELRVSVSEVTTQENEEEFEEFSTDLNSQSVHVGYEEKSVEDKSLSDGKQGVNNNSNVDDNEEDDFADFCEPIGDAASNNNSGWAAFSSDTKEIDADKPGGSENESDWAAFGSSEDTAFAEPAYCQREVKSEFRNNVDDDADDDGDDFGDFGDFSEGTEAKDSTAAFSALKVQEISYQEQNKEKLIAACFLEESMSASHEDIWDFGDVLDGKYSRLKDTSKPLWEDLMYQDAEKLSQLWQDSLGSSKLFSSLHIDTRNILLGHKKPSVPVYAAGLGLLEPTKGPVSKETQKESKLVNMSKPEKTVSQDMPPVQFDWTGSGLTNPLEANKTLGLDFLEVQETNVSKSEKLPGFEVDVDEGTKERKTSLQPLESILANIKPTMVVNLTENLSSEAQKIINSLPNLRFMQSKVLMFPIHSMSDNQ